MKLNNVKDEPQKIQSYPSLLKQLPSTNETIQL